MAKTNELKNKTIAELNDLLNKTRKKLYFLRFDHSSGQLSDISIIRKVRRDIARILTACNIKLKVNK
jgi:large subunit ribosomal protein L29